MSIVKPTVLKIGKIVAAHQEWEALSRIATLVDIEPGTTRESFIADCATRYRDVTAIWRANSLEYTGAIDADLVAALPASLKFIAHQGAGYDNVDPAALLQRNILLANCPTAVDGPTANVALWLMLGCFRNLYRATANLRAGRWNTGLGLAHEPDGKTLGVLGMGGIGRALAKRARAFDMEIIYHNRKRLPVEQEAGAEYVSFDALLARSDCISISVPLNAKTRHLISKRELDKCKKGVIIVNTARGPVVDEAALVEALESGQVGNVGLDVFEQEPEIHPGLLKSDKAILLPHVGTSTFEGRYAMEMVCIKNIQNAIERGVLNNVVPELAEIRDVHKYAS